MTEVTIKITKNAHWKLLKNFLMTFNIGFEVSRVSNGSEQNGSSSDFEPSELAMPEDVQNNDSDTNDLLQQAIKPIRATINIEDLIREQNYTNFDKEGFESLIAQLDIQDPIEELLAYN
ncbi:MAG: hypothetical protein JNL70_22525 [Saprospiraceae bacterium]|nr:hypothetical protein [Saprospiraceae bacterium]